MKGSFGIPDSCTSSDDCDFLVTYQNVVDNVEFELSGKAGWAGVGFSDDTNMADTDILICASDRSKSGHYYAEGRSTPPMTRPTPSAVTIIEHSNDGGVVKCKIAREINPGIENFRNLNESWFLLGAIGDFRGDQIQQHRVRQTTNSRINVTDASGSASGSDAGIDNFIIVHGTLMTLAWILFAFVGLFTARYMRQVWEPTQLLGTKTWFAVHRTLMTLTVLLTVAGTVVIFVGRKGWSSGAGVHPYFGIVVVALALAQPIMAAFRPHPGEPRRNIFNWTHRIVGTLALILGVVAIFFGLDQFLDPGDDSGLYAVITFYIAEFLVFVFEVYLILSKRNREKRSVPIGTTRDIPMEQPGHQTRASPEPDMPVKEAMIRNFMFIFVVLVGASVSLTIILLIVLK
ncbi:putative ferric-chelate reductase 1 isoform X2 [Oculina patagonica]